jgi:hypothetical protein
MVRPIVRPVASTTRRETLDGLPDDPHNRYLDKLPQPFRRIDKLVAELIEGALDVAWEREAKAREEAARPKTAVRIPLAATPSRMRPVTVQAHAEHPFDLARALGEPCTVTKGAGR